MRTASADRNSPRKPRRRSSLDAASMQSDTMLARVKEITQSQKEIQDVLQDLKKGQLDVQANIRHVCSWLRHVDRDRNADDMSSMPSAKKFNSTNSSRARPPDLVHKVSSAGLPLQGRKPSSDTGSIHEEAEEENGSQDSQCEAMAPLLPLRWPVSIEIRELMSETDLGGVVTGGTTNRRLDLGFATLGRASEANTENIRSGMLQQWIADHVVLRPDYICVVVFDLLSLLVLAFDLIIIPYTIAWSVKLDGFWLVITWMTVFFWSLDMFVNCLRGFHRDGKVILMPKEIIANYVRGWFLPDLVIVVCDWASLLLLVLVDPGSSSNTVRFLRFAKAGRFMRIMGFLRFVKFVRVMEDLVQTRMSDSQQLMLRVTSLVFGILYLNHIFACMWYLIGIQAHADTGLRWPNDALNDFQDQGIIYQYFTTMHWSVSQMTLGAIEITCQNTAERAANIACLIFGLLFGSTLVSSLSATMVEFQMMRNGISQRMRTLRQFLRDNQVGVGVTMRVQKQVAERLAAKPKITEKDVAVLELLSLSLRAELRYEVFKTNAQMHPLFLLWDCLDEMLMRRLCNVALEYSFLRASDELFVPGAPCDEAYMVVNGLMQYVLDPDSFPVQERSVSRVEEKQWLSEAAMWTYWFHVGVAEAVRPTQLLVVHADLLPEVMQIRHIAREITEAYCFEYHRRVVGATPPNAPWPTDFHIPFTEFGDLVQSLEMSHQVRIGTCAVDRVVAKSRHRLYGRLLNDLFHEVETGKCTVMLNADGDLERVVSVVALSIMNKERKVLVQVGKYTGTEVSVGCQLPGSKQERGELVSDAAQRILEGKLAPLADFIRIANTARQIELKQSKEFGINTKYLRTVCNCHLEDAQVAITAKNQLEQLNEPDLTASFGQSTGGLSGIRIGRRSTNTERELMHIGDKDRGSFYAWLSMEEFHALKVVTPEAEIVKQLTKMGIEVSFLEIDHNGKIYLVNNRFDASPATRSVEALEAFCEAVEEAAGADDGDVVDEI